MIVIASHRPYHVRLDFRDTPLSGRGTADHTMVLPVLDTGHSGPNARPDFRDTPWSGRAGCRPYHGLPDSVTRHGQAAATADHAMVCLDFPETRRGLATNGAKKWQVIATFSLQLHKCI